MTTRKYNRRKAAQNKASCALEDARDAAFHRLLTAKDDADIINAIGESLHLKHRCNGRIIECPVELLPSLDKMHQFVFPDEATNESVDLAKRLLDTDTARGIDSLFTYHVGGECIPLWQLQERWRDEQDKGNALSHPVSPLVRAFMELNPIAPRDDGSIIPSSLGNIGPAERTARHAGEEFYLNGGDDNQVNMIDLPANQHPRSFPMRLYYLGGKPGHGGGRGAPLAFRLFVEAILSADHRCTGMPQTIEIPPHLLKEMLYPNGWKPARDIPLIREAAYKLGHPDACIPVRNDKGYWEWQVVAAIGRPMDAKTPLIIQVNLPAGCGPGPRINRHALRKYGVESAPLYRGLLNVAYYMSREGKTLFGKRIRGKKVYRHMTDPTSYGDELIIEKTSGDLSSKSKKAEVEIVRLFYPETEGRRDNEFSKYLNRSLCDFLPRLIQDGHVYIVEGRLLPPDAVGKGKNNKPRQASLIDDDNE